jgi:UDP:flavonoid glycosyltransferase YjiC (YdhE family)
MAKRIFIATSGSRGDVEPFIALSKALQNAGYGVVLAAPPDFGGWIASHGIAHQPIGDAARGYVDELASAIERNKFFRSLKNETFEQRAYALYADLLKASEGADLLIFSMMLAGMTSVAEARRIPAIGVYLQPLLTTADFAIPMQRRFSYGGFLNRLSHRAADLALWTLFRGWWNAMRRDVLGLKPLGRFHDMRTVNGKPMPLLFAISEALLSRPRDWPDHASMTGNWFLDGGEDWTPPPDLAAFLKEGPAPVYVGFGSMPLGQSKSKAHMIIEALKLSGQRAVIARGWGGWDDDIFAPLGANAHVIDAAPHRKLFPLMAGVVHHGGAGTTAACFRAGRPAFVTPLILDQFFYANLVRRHGAGPKALPVKSWHPLALARQLAELTSVPGYGRRAREVSERMAKENGLARAKDVVQSVIGLP